MITENTTITNEKKIEYFMWYMYDAFVHRWPQMEAIMSSLVKIKHMPNIMWDEIHYRTDEVWEWISNFTAHFIGYVSAAPI